MPFLNQFSGKKSEFVIFRNSSFLDDVAAVEECEPPDMASIGVLVLTMVFFIIYSVKSVLILSYLFKYGLDWGAISYCASFLWFFQGAVFLLIILLALFGNLLVIVSVLRTKNLRSISCQNCSKGLTKINWILRWKVIGSLRKGYFLNFRKLSHLFS